MSAQVIPFPEYQPANWDAEVGARVKVLLSGRATQAELGEVLGLSQTDVSKRISGRVPWKGRELDTVAKALSVSVSVLFGEPEGLNPSDGSGAGSVALPFC